MEDHREMYIRNILDMTKEHGLSYTQEQLDQVPEDQLIELRDKLRMKYENINFKRYC